MKDYLGSKFFSGILAKQITESWKQRGKQVDVWVEEIPSFPGLFQVRSNIKFGSLEDSDANG